MKILSFDVGIVNLAYCIFDSIECKIQHWEVITLENDPKFTAHVGNATCQVYINLIKELDNRKHLLDVDIVIIEKQPSFNPKMRIIGGCLQTYFYIRGMVDINLIKSVEFFSPKHKLKCYTGPELNTNSKSKSKYVQTKKMGILICNAKLNEYNETNLIKEIFEKSKKKDDLADCYLQAITYAEFKKNNFKVLKEKVVKSKKVVKSANEKVIEEPLIST